MNRTIRKSAIAAGLAVTLIALAGCQRVAKIDKAGAPTKAVRVITLQMPDAGDPDGLFFAQDVAAISHGTLRVAIDPTTYNGADPTYATRLVAAMRTGQVGFSYEPARDWAAAGVSSLEAIQAPFLITTVHTSELLANSPLAGEALRGLSTVGMVGIGLIPTQPRQILSTKPLFAPSRFDGLRVRVTNNPQTVALLSALGASPVQNLSAGQAGTQLLSGSIGAIETSATAIMSNSYNADAPYLTSYAVLPKFETIVATRTAWAALTTAQQTAMRDAAANTLLGASQVSTRETGQLLGLCRSGVILDQPSRAALTTLAREARRATPLNTAATALVRQIRSTIPGTGPQPSAVPTSGCHVAHTIVQATRFRSLYSNHRSQGRGGPTIPPGTYVTTDTPADYAAGDATNPDFSRATTITTELYSSGRVVEITRPKYADQPTLHGHYVVSGNEITFFWNRGPYVPTPETLRWSYFDGQLTFAIVHVQDQGGQVLYTAHPWRKVD